MFQLAHHPSNQQTSESPDHDHLLRREEKKKNVMYSTNVVIEVHL